MELSIIIVNYNTKKLTLDCVKSIKSSKPKVKYEIIIVDNNSSDKLSPSKDYKLINNQTNSGFAKANNQGIKLSKGKYIFLLNSDTKVARGTIDKIYEFAKSQIDAGAIVPRLYSTDGSIQASCFKFPTISSVFKQYFLNQDKLLNKYFPRTDKPVAVDVAVMAAFLITPYALKKVGKLNEKYFMYFEDFDYCRKIKEKGLKVYYLPEAQVVHIHGASGGKNQFLIDSAKIYHGFVGYYVYTFILWLGQKWQKFLKTQN